MYLTGVYMMIPMIISLILKYYEIVLTSQIWNFCAGFSMIFNLILMNHVYEDASVPLIGWFVMPAILLVQQTIIWADIIWWLTI